MSEGDQTQGEVGAKPGGGDRHPAQEARDEALLDASRDILQLFLQAGTSAFSVKEMAAHSGLSERTFYRYFPRKELVVRPYIDLVMAQIVADIRAYPPSRPLQEALVAAHARAYRDDPGRSWEALLPVLSEQESLRAMWLQILTDAEATLAGVISERLNIPPGSLRARLTSAVVVAAGRMAVEQRGQPEPRRDPIEVFAECLEVLGGALFEEAGA